MRDISVDVSVQYRMVNFGCMTQREEGNTNSPSFAVLPLRSITQSSKNRSMMGSKLDNGVDLNRLLEKISETLANAAAG